MKLTATHQPLTFYEICKRHREDPDDLGDVCSEIASDRSAPVADESLRYYLLRAYNDRPLIRRLWGASLLEKTSTTHRR